MTHSENFVAADLGASSGRLMVGQWNGRTFSLDELHRFPNGGIRVAGSLYWDVLRIWSEIQTGLSKYRTRFENAPAAIGVDAWGVDFALLDQRGRLLGNPYHYRDSRTDGIPELVFERIDKRKLFTATGVQTMQINTLFQLCSMVRTADPQLDLAATLLMIPDLFHYFLCGARAVEHSEATTTQMYASSRSWARTFLDTLEIPVSILTEVIFPGTQLGPIRLEVLRDTGLKGTFPVVAVASHDTASAVAAIPNMDESSAFISSGTWSLMGVECREPVTSDEAFALNFTNEGGADGSILLLKNITGLWILQECQRHWSSEGHSHSWSDITEMAAAAPAFQCVVDVEANDLHMSENMPSAIAAYCRRTLQPEPQTIGAIARCCFESLSLRYRSVLESLEALTGRRLATIRVVGGGCLNALLCQMTADACNRIVVSGPAEASAFGNVMLQAIATGRLPSMRAGRAVIAESIACTIYHPQRTTPWDESYVRMEQIQACA
ncbi:MAG TPA: rhamnulokinase family protein [Acidobacteriaceae bacterium]|nr:rhamnulokinase family protein [Terriglobia bacterium]HVC91513.1 rhamnulokinase family protein [Acidobacteriaceae bacterium]